MSVFYQGQKVNLSPTRLLGRGGEASVYRWRKKALKVFDAKVVDMAAKETKLLALPTDLPDGVVGPEAWLVDDKGAFAGYAMPLVSDAFGLKRLGLRRFREGLYTANQVLELFGSLHRLVTTLHQRGIILGDFNDGNVLVVNEGGRLEARLIDIDSLHLPGHPCRVGHPKFVPPELLGVDFSTGDHFSEGTDWYAFATLFFATFVYVHPFGGVHPKYPTLTRRLEARASIFRTEVKRPSLALSPGHLGQGCADWLRETFETPRREDFPAGFLSARFTVCPCGSEYRGARCPDCAVAQPHKATMVSYHGGIKAQVIRQTTGRLLAVSAESQLKYLTYEDGELYREDNTCLGALDLSAHTTASLSHRRTWLTMGPTAVAFDGTRTAAKHRLSTFDGLAAFAASGAHAFGVQNDWLVDLENDQRITPVVENQTWLAVGPHLGVGCYRAGSGHQTFIFTPGRVGAKTIDGIIFGGTVTSLNAAFDHDRVLLAVNLTGPKGDVTELYLIHRDSRVLGTITQDSSWGADVGAGLLLRGGVPLIATDKGLMRLEVDATSRTLQVEQVFDDTAPWVSAEAKLLADPAGGVYVVTPRRIVLLTPNQRK